VNAARIVVGLALGTLVLLPAVAAAQQPSKSAPLAAELAKLLDDHKLDSIAAKSADDYVGALYFPGAQLLVVKAKYSVPARMDSMLTQKAYRDAYLDLNSATDPKSKTFISDLGANGLRAKRESNQLDTVDTARGSLVFDGDWDKAKISEAEYMKRYQASDDEYAQMLQALIAALKKPS
jgi:hypothetical protein